MRKTTPSQRVFPSADEDKSRAGHVASTPQALSPAFRLAFADPDFLGRDELRPVRLQLELLKPELAMGDLGITSTVVLFGGARVPRPGDAVPPKREWLKRFYQEAQDFARLVGGECVRRGGGELVVVTGGGPGVMEAGNRGAHEAGAPSMGFNIVLPHEQEPNHYVTPELSFNFHYFGIRKMHFLMRARAIAVFPGGYGTLDELFETLTLIQTQRMRPLPVLLFGSDFWDDIVNWQALVDAGTIAPEDLDLFHFVDTAEEGWAHVKSALGITE
ncbi:TIGR00730 family Rossman fold protein [Limibaculum sp. M0105]|uniref:Cytokinin riboside 5'-monophosphate phosphoribohydrolase n=1 Tax=Thermohalobaculum xanthum TaxID=2753746 RepID=A0A8J7SGT0_9RHOB|nr:TIGR00730 family Rossman fold protein [Thermohalobaculum xanthum]MBK0401161.1 TIGR00730 family Rossman fold protein [Thermohalobaculum xanthum]